MDLSKVIGEPEICTCDNTCRPHPECPAHKLRMASLMEQWVSAASGNNHTKIQREKSLSDQLAYARALIIQLKERDETWQRVINTQYVPRIAELEAQLKAAKRDAILDIADGRILHSALVNYPFSAYSNACKELKAYANTIGEE